MKNKKAQYYFFAIILIAVLFVGLITISNFARIKKVTSLENYQSQINNERSSLLDYLSSQTFSEAESNEKFENFSNVYISQIGTDKTIIFIFGTGSNGNIIANMASNLTASIEGISLPQGGIDQTFVVSGDIDLQVDGNSYTFNFQDGQNIYYLMELKKNNEDYIIYG